MRLQVLFFILLAKRQFMSVEPIIDDGLLTLNNMDSDGHMITLLCFSLQQVKNGHMPFKIMRTTLLSISVIRLLVFQIIK